MNDPIRTEPGRDQEAASRRAMEILIDHALRYIRAKNAAAQERHRQAIQNLIDRNEIRNREERTDGRND